MEGPTVAVATVGDGYGYGYGYGSGYGDGDGYGDGCGYGSGSGSKAEYFHSVLEPFAREDAEVVFWRSKMNGSPANGGSGMVAKVGLEQEIPGPLRMCSAGALHGTLSPESWKGERWWVVALHHPVERQSDKMGSLKRTILADLGRCPF